MKKKIGIPAGCAFLLLFTACSHLPPSAMRAEYTDIEPPADLSGAAWRNAPEYRFTPYSAGPWYQEIERVSGMRGRVLEGGAIRLLWNENYLYVGIRMDDSDIVDEAARDQTHIFTQADAVELFLKHEAYPCYWEIYGSAGGRKSCYFFPGRGRLGLPGSSRYRHGVTVRTSLGGTLNNEKDRDRGWTLLIKVPAADLTRHGAEWKAGEKWTIHLVRHNYSVYLPSREVSVFPEFHAGNPHFHEGYAPLVLAKRGKELK